MGTDEEGGSTVGWCGHRDLNFIPRNPDRRRGGCGLQVGKWGRRDEGRDTEKGSLCSGAMADRVKSKL